MVQPKTDAEKLGQARAHRLGVYQCMCIIKCN